MSQFISPHKKRLLGELNFSFPEGTSAVGRLDDNSEGLLILTTDKSLSHELLLPQKQHKRTYVVQVEKNMTQEKLEQLINGVPIVTPREGLYLTKPCTVCIIPKPSWLPKRGHEFREDLPQTWIELVLTEGKFHQVRKMTAAIGHPTKRLIRTGIEGLHLHGLQPGEVKELSGEYLFSALGLTNR